METRRILLDGVATTVTREGDELVSPDGRRMPLDDPIHLPPVQPTKVVCVHLNYESRRAEFQATLGPAPIHCELGPLGTHVPGSDPGGRTCDGPVQLPAGSKVRASFECLSPRCASTARS